MVLFLHFYFFVFFLIKYVVLVEMLAGVTFSYHSLDICDAIEELGSSLELFVFIEVVHIFKLYSWDVILGYGVDHQLVMAIKLAEVGPTLGTLIRSGQTVFIKTTFELVIIFEVGVQLICSYLV